MTVMWLGVACTIAFGAEQAGTGPGRFECAPLALMEHAVVVSAKKPANTLPCFSAHGARIGPVREITSMM